MKYLVRKGYWVRVVDIKEREYEATAAHEWESLDFRRFDNCLLATRSVDEVYQLAADMGGIGYISTNHADITRNTTLINGHMLEAARASGVMRFLFSSSACVYSQHLQTSPDVTPLKEEDAWPAAPEEGYGLEKLFMEKLCQYYRKDHGLATRVVRFHNVYGPLGTYDGGKEKALAAICRKVALASEGGEVEVWGDGEQTRSFMYVDDCVEGIRRLMRSDCPHPLNLGTEEMVTIDGLVEVVARIAGKRVQEGHNIAGPRASVGGTATTAGCAGPSAGSRKHHCAKVSCPHTDGSSRSFGRPDAFRGPPWSPRRPEDRIGWPRAPGGGRGGAEPVARAPGRGDRGGPLSHSSGRGPRRVEMCGRGRGQFPAGLLGVVGADSAVWRAGLQAAG